MLIWGFTGILGRVISLGALDLVWWRLAIVTATLLLFPSVRVGLRTMGAKLAAAYAAIGVIVALHWLTFYQSIKVSNASVGATCMALAPVFVAFLEPVLTRRSLSWREVTLGVAVVPGVVLVVGGIPPRMHEGIAYGAVSAFLVGIFGSLNKRFAHRADPLAITAVELGVGALFTTGIAIAANGARAIAIPSLGDAGWLLVLAWACTLLPYALSLLALRSMSAFTAQLAVNLEPVYTIAIATVWLHEQRDLDARFYVGVSIVLAAVFARPLRLALNSWVARRAAPRAT